MKTLIDCALGRTPCDLVLRGARIFNVFTGRTEEGDLAVKAGRIVAIGTGYEGAREYDARGLIALPGFIDSHIHVESSMLSPEEFASLCVPHGTTGIVADPHELVNVCGIEGAEYLKEAFSRLRCGEVSPLEVWMQLPSCVPATPFETSGARIDGAETERELARGIFHGLGEMMNYPGVLACDGDVLKKLSAAAERGMPVDGHAPALTGRELNAYLCAGIATDHECLSAEECREKAARGMYVQLRHGSSAAGLPACAPAVDAFNFRRFLLCSDDKSARDLMQKGHMDDALRTLVSCGVPAEQAVVCATLNPAQCYRLAGKGALAPGYDADLVLVEDLCSFRVRAVFRAGTLVAENGKANFGVGERYLPRAVRSTVRIRMPSEDDLRICVSGGRARAMYVLPHSLVTESEIVPVTCQNGDVVLGGSDLCKLAVVERHKASGNVGLGLVRGYGLKGGAIGISVAHDSHNLVVLGDNNADMLRVVARLQETGGGMVLSHGGRIASFPLDIAGLMSSAPAEEVARCTAELAAQAHGMGVKDCYEPFMTLAFLSLAVIPKLKLTDRGLFDVERFAFTEIEP